MSESLGKRFQEHFCNLIKQLRWAHRLPKPRQTAGKQVHLGPMKKGRKKTLILDLDETLVHCSQSDNIVWDTYIDMDIDQIG